MEYNVRIEDEKNYGIYIIENTKNGMCYIGQTRSGFRKRYLKHISGFKNGYGHTNKFSEDYKKYGPDAFEFRILCIENDVTKLNDLERKYITLYNSVRNGYNTMPGGNTVYGNNRVEDVFKNTRVITDEFKARRSEYMKNRVVSDDTKDRLRFANTGERSPVAVLNESIVKCIKSDIVSGATIKDTANKYRQNYNTVSAVVHGFSWKHVSVDGWDEFLERKRKDSKRHKFTDDEVLSIRLLLDSGMSENKIANMYNCSSSKINALHRNLTYKDVK